MEVPVTDRLFVCTHPLVRHKLGVLRNKDTSTRDFRSVVGELALLLGYEATRDVPLVNAEVETPLERTTCECLARDIVIVPILRAGLSMSDALLGLLPFAHVGHIGMRRDEVTHKAVSYYSNLPRGIEGATCLLVDPMLATGGSLIDAIGYLRRAGVSDLRALTLVSAPQGVRAVLAADPLARLYACAIDRCLNDDAYILPGLGDTGDRIFGTKG